MRKLIYKCLTLITLSTMILSCSTEEENKEINNLNLYKDVNELIEFSKIHSEGLKHNIKAFENEIKSLKGKNKNLNENDIIAFFEKETNNFLNKNNINYNNKNISFESEKIIELNQSFNLDNARFKHNKTYSDNEAIADVYYQKIENAFKDNPYDTVISELHNVYQDFLTEELSIPDNEKLSIEIMIGIAFDSATYWNDFRNNKISQNKSSKFKWNWGVALADVKGAIGGGLWGSAVAGPLGGAVMAVNMAIIDSSVAHVISELPTP